MRELKIICIKNSGVENITIGKVYNVRLNIYDKYYDLIDDRGYLCVGIFNKDYFITLAEYRENQINDIFYE